MPRDLALGGKRKWNATKGITEDAESYDKTFDHAISKTIKTETKKDTSAAVAADKTSTSGATVTTQASRQGAVGGVDTGGTGTINERRTYLNANYYNLKFKKEWNFFSHPWAKRMINKGISPNQRTYMSTSMAFIPIHYPFLYATKSEWDNLPLETYAKHCSMKLSMWNCRTSFQTNATDATTATQGNQLWINFMGDVFKYPCAAVKNTGSDTNPVLTTDIESLKGDDLKTFSELLYGPADITSLNAIPPGICGTWVEWNWYVAFICASNAPSTGAYDATCGLWTVGEAYDSFLAVNNANSFIYRNTCDLGGVLITKQKDLLIPAVPATQGTNYIIPWNEDHFANPGYYETQTTHKTIAPNQSNQATQTLFEGNAVGWLESMYRPERHHLYPGKSGNTNKPPKAIAFGLEEIPAMTAANDKFEYQEGQIFWKLECELDLMVKREYMSMYSDRKQYVDGIYTYGQGPVLLPEDEGQGFLYGRPFAIA